MRILSKICGLFRINFPVAIVLASVAVTGRSNRALILRADTRLAYRYCMVTTVVPVTVPVPTVAAV